MAFKEIPPPFVQYESPYVTLTVALGPNIDESGEPYVSPSDSAIRAEIVRFVESIHKINAVGGL